ncbi:MAG: hypothetical protein KTR30_33840 [Saprospiraceae bacterium]|nr:hypothetical protein [Saprospiraceae bacterium]
MKKNLKLQTGLIILMTLLAALSRLIPHPPNFTPLGAMALFGAAYFTKKHLAFLIPLAAWWISDIVLNNLVYAKLYPEIYQGFSWMGNPVIYLCLGLIVVLGWVLLKKVNTVRVIGAAALAAIVFFLITNFNSMLTIPIYTKDINGLLESYIAGIPFFRNTLVGNLIYSALLFGVYEWVLARRGAKNSSALVEA